MKVTQSKQSQSYGDSYYPGIVLQEPNAQGRSSKEAATTLVCSGRE